MRRRRDHEDSMCCGEGRPQGGDVSGERPIDMRGATGAALRVSDASYDPGYPLETTLNDAGIDHSKADVIRGYCTYGKAIGEDE